MGDKRLWSQYAKAEQAHLSAVLADSINASVSMYADKLAGIIGQLQRVIDRIGGSRFVCRVERCLTLLVFRPTVTNASI